MDMDTALPEMIPVVDIQFLSGGKNYTFDPGDLTLEAGQEVIIDTQRGLEFGICQQGNHIVPSSQVVQPLRPVVRLADDADRQRLKDNTAKEAQAFDTCQLMVERMALDMKLVRVECAFDGSKLLFFFTSDGRVDFRELVKELASVYRTRIEMRQIGVRDEAKLLGGLGICGRPFCCAQFLDDFQPVSIKMAKTQSLSLNPTKISGTCGRLMCCLKYEQEAYEDLLKTCPRQGSLVDTVDGRGTVQDVSLLKQQVKVSLEDSPDTVKYYDNTAIAVLRDGKGKKTDPPIPKEIAPISGDPERRAQLLASAAEKARVDDPFPTFEEPEFFAPAAEVPAAEAKPEKKPAESNRSRSRRRRSHRSDGQGEAPKQESAQRTDQRSNPQEEKRGSTRNESAPARQPRNSHRPPKQQPNKDAAAGEAPADKPASSSGRRRPHRGSRGGHGGQKPPKTETP